MILRKAIKDDMDFLLELRNEETVRASSINTELISKDSHEKWFAEKISDANAFILIAEDDEQRIGQIRFDKIKGKPCAEVDVAVKSKKRGLGIGTEIVKRGSDMAFEFLDISKITSHIKPENAISARTFEKAGYKNNGVVEQNGQKFIEMVLERN